MTKVIKKALHLPVPDGPHHVLGESTYTYCSFVTNLMPMQGLAADACQLGNCIRLVQHALKTFCWGGALSDTWQLSHTFVVSEDWNDLGAVRKKTGRSERLQRYRSRCGAMLPQKACSSGPAKSKVRNGVPSTSCGFCPDFS